MVAQPDRVEEHWPERCASCGEALSRGQCDHYERRQVHDLPPRQIEVTEHRAMAVRCAHCGSMTRASFPEGGEPAGAIHWRGWRCVQVYQMLPLERTADLLEEISGRRLSEGTLVNLLAGCAGRARLVMERVQVALVEAAVLNTNETGIRVGKQLYWLHTHSNERLTYYAVHEWRGQAAHKQIGILPGYRGTVIHDAYASYLKWRERNPAVTHGLCNAHLLRDLTAIEGQTG